MTSPAADWLPFDLEVARREPERVRHTDYPDWRGSSVNAFDGEYAARIAWNWSDDANDFCYYGPAMCLRVLRLAPPPAQPAEGEWHPTSTLPAEGRVVELRMKNNQPIYLPRGRAVGGAWEYASAAGSFIKASHVLIPDFEWRYPPGEMAEATPANEQANTVMVHTMRNGSGWLCSCVHCDRLRAAAKGGDAHANEARHRPGLSEASNAVTGAGASVTTPRAAPQRQNLTTQCWNCRETYLMAQRSCPNCLSANANHCFDLALEQNEAKELPPLRSAVLAREVTEMRRALRGRAPWPVEARKRLDPLLASAFRVWK